MPIHSAYCHFCDQDIIILINFLNVIVTAVSLSRYCK